MNKMYFKLRSDLDLLQRCLIVVFASSAVSYILSYILFDFYSWSQLFLTIGLIGSVLKSSLRLAVDDKSVLITGCDTGFGLVLAKHLHGLGFQVFAGCLLADRDGPGAAELRLVNSARLHVVQLDVTRDEDWKKVKQYIIDNLPRTSNGLWGIVNNAGWATFGEVEWVSMETYRKAVDVNLFGLINGIKTMLPLIRQAKGRVVTITSGLARMAVPTRSPYVLSKYGLEGFLDCLRYEMEPFGVGVSMLEPGNFIAGTNIFNEAFVKSQGKLMWDGMDDEVKKTYKKEYFDKKVEVMRSYMNTGITDISPVIDSYTDALLDAFPQARYQPMDWYFKTRCFIATHFPEIVYRTIYI